MPRSVAVLSLLFLLLLASLQPASAQDNEIFFHDGTRVLQLTENTDDDEEPGINDAGTVVWQHYEYKIGGDLYDWDAAICFFDGRTTTTVRSGPVRFDSFMDVFPQINADGHIAWVSMWWTATTFHRAVFRFDGEGVHQMTGYGGIFPPIFLNDNGTLVWPAFQDGLGVQLYLHDGEGGTRIPIPDGYYPWQSYDASSYGVAFPAAPASASNPYAVDVAAAEIFLYDGVSTLRLTHNGYMDDDPSVNDAGQVAWLAEPPDGDDAEVFLFDGASVLRLTDNDLDEVRPEINAQGKAAWCTVYSEEPGLDSEIFLYDGSRVIQLTDNDTHDGDHQIGNGGAVVWKGKEGGENDYEIFLHDGFSVRQVTDNDYSDMEPRINFSGQLAWVARPPDPPYPCGTALVRGPGARSACSPASGILFLTGSLAVLLIARRRARRR